MDDKTLGALLGGIAGYVLSQGVGQSASRQAVRAAIAGGQAQFGATAPNLIPPKPASGRPNAEESPAASPAAAANAVVGNVSEDGPETVG